MIQNKMEYPKEKVVLLSKLLSENEQKLCSVMDDGLISGMTGEK